MIVIGIDFSIQFPAVCITRDFQSFKWIACVNTQIPKVHRKFLDDLELECKEFRFIHLEPRNKNKDTYSIIERSKLVNYSTLVDALVAAIKQEINGEERIIVSIEGVSYGAQGNALLDINQATGMLRKAILDRVLAGHDEKIFIFSPGELKNAIGAKGNAGKFDVFQAFLNNSPLGTINKLHLVINKYADTIIKSNGTDIKPPFTDMIDSYLAVLKIHNELSKEPADDNGIKSKTE